MRGVFVLALLYKDNKILSIYRNIKSQDHFSVTFHIRKNGNANKLELMLVTLERINEAK